MKNRFLFLGLLLFMTTANIFAQDEIKTLFNKDGDKKSIRPSYYAAPVIGVTQLNNQPSLYLGGQVGLILWRQFMVGLSAKSIVFPRSFIDNSSGLQRELGYGWNSFGGLAFEYILFPKSPVHISFPVNVMAGYMSIKDRNIDQHIESSIFLSLEGGINIDFNISKRFFPSIQVTYRRAVGSSLQNLSDDALSGFNVGLILRVGRLR